MSGLFYRITQNFSNIFKSKNLLWHLAAFVLTYVLVHFGIDWKYFSFWQPSVFSNWLFLAVILGLVVPILLPIILLIAGAVKKSAALLNSGFALAQAAFLGWLLSIIYKALTGRSGPPGRLNFVTTADISHVFNFGLARGGIFWGWPSSHTTVAFATGIALFTIYSENKFIKYLALIYAIYIGFGVSTNIHWLSDALAGAIFGSLVGISVGTSFKERIKI